MYDRMTERQEAEVEVVELKIQRFSSHSGVT